MVRVFFTKPFFQCENVVDLIPLRIEYDHYRGARKIQITVCNIMLQIYWEG